MDYKIEIPTDSNGFYSLGCPKCNGRFKASAEDVEGEDKLQLFCPFCGLVDEKSTFVPMDVIELAQKLAIYNMKHEIYKSVKKSNRRMRGIKIFDAKKSQAEEPELLPEDEDLQQIELDCCGKIIKVNDDQKKSNVYCPFCGKN